MRAFAIGIPLLFGAFVLWLFGLALADWLDGHRQARERFEEQGQNEAEAFREVRQLTAIEISNRAAERLAERRAERLAEIQRAKAAENGNRSRRAAKGRRR